MQRRSILTAILLLGLVQPLFAAKKKKPAPPDLAKLLPGTSWQWHTIDDEQSITFQPDGLVHHAGWAKRKLVTSWKVIDQRTVMLRIEEGRGFDRTAVLTFNKKATQFTGTDFARGRKIKPSRKLPPVRARHIVTVTDDFVVEVHHNGKRVPDSQRKLLSDHFGATAERTERVVRAGDWLVFHVANNRLRWGGACYFGAAGVLDEKEFGFVSELKSGAWSVCDDPAKAKQFIARKTQATDNAARAPKRAWKDGPGLMRKFAGRGWNGTAVWGSERSCWIKVIIPPAE